MKKAKYFTTCGELTSSFSQPIIGINELHPERLRPLLISKAQQKRATAEQQLSLDFKDDTPSDSTATTWLSAAMSSCSTKPRLGQESKFAPTQLISYKYNAGWSQSSSAFNVKSQNESWRNQNMWNSICPGCLRYLRISSRRRSLPGGIGFLLSNLSRFFSFLFSSFVSKI